MFSFNASDEQALYKAFRSELNYKEYPYSFPDDVLSELLDAIKEHRLDISHMICSGAGLKLMNIDSRICDYVIADFLKTDTPILIAHDSFIVPIGHEVRLDQLMQEAFRQVAMKASIKAKFNQNLTDTHLYEHSLKKRGWFLDMLQSLFKSMPTNSYQRRLQRHVEHFGR